MVHNLKDVHSLGSGTIIYAKDTDEQECRTTHKHKGKFHGGVFLLSASPYADEQIHRDERNLVEHEHGEEVGRDEETENSGTQKGEPEEIFFRHRLQTP